MAGVDYSQFKGKPFQVVSKLGVRYTGIFDHISQEDQTICLAQVFNHGTEDRPSARKLAGSSTTLGWVRFHTESIASLALVENYVPPGEEAPVDPILASVSQNAPSSSAQPSQRSATSHAQSPPASRHDLPAKPSHDAISAATALDRVQASMNDLSVDNRPRRRAQQPAQPIEVPDAEFDFSAGTTAFEKERSTRRGRNDSVSEQDDEDADEPELAPHPSVLASMGPPRGDTAQSQLDDEGKKASSVYKKSSFFDGLSGESSRISRNEERHRNFDTFGEAGGNDQAGHQGGGHSRGRGGGYGGRGRGGYGQQNQGQGYGQRDGQGQGYGNQSQGFNRQSGQDGQNGFGGRGRGRGYNRGGAGGGAGGYQQRQEAPHQAQY